MLSEPATCKILQTPENSTTELQMILAHVGEEYDIVFQSLFPNWSAARVFFQLVMGEINDCSRANSPMLLLLLIDSISAYRRILGDFGNLLNLGLSVHVVLWQLFQFCFGRKTVDGVDSRTSFHRYANNIWLKNVQIGGSMLGDEIWCVVKLYLQISSIFRGVTMLVTEFMMTFLANAEVNCILGEEFTVRWPCQ